MTCNPPLVNPDVILAGDTYVIMHIGVAEDGSRHYDYLMETYNDLFDAERTCAALNAVDHDSYQVVTINKDVKVIHNDAHHIDIYEALKSAPIAVKTDTSDSDRAIGALRFVYQMLDEGLLDTESILNRLRGYCEHANLVEFA